jgi:uncharacterized protein YaaW (UPF0174 family)
MGNNTHIFDADLNPVLENSSNEDLEILVSYLNKKMSCGLTKSDAYKRHSPNHSKYADLIAKEIRDMGGNSFANLFRGEGPSYYEIVCDVADKLKAPYNKEKSIEDIEHAILETILVKTFDSMSNDEKKKFLASMSEKAGLSKGGITSAALIAIFRSGGFYSYQLTLMIANQIARQVLGRGLMLATNAGLTRTLSVLTGPIGWVITGLWTALDLAGPAYSVTIPCVVHVAMLRKKLNALECKNCGALLTDTTAKFCPECGHPTENKK